MLVFMFGLVALTFNQVRLNDACTLYTFSFDNTWLIEAILNPIWRLARDGLAFLLHPEYK